MNFVRFLRTPFTEHLQMTASARRIRVWRSKLPIINIGKMTLKSKITTLKNFIEMRHMTLNNPKFDIKKSLDTLTRHRVKRKKHKKIEAYRKSLYKEPLVNSCLLILGLKPIRS